jgi:hypothetical protein
VAGEGPALYQPLRPGTIFEKAGPRLIFGRVVTEREPLYKLKASNRLL